MDYRPGLIARVCGPSWFFTWSFKLLKHFWLCCNLCLKPGFRLSWQQQWGDGLGRKGAIKFPPKSTLPLVPTIVINRENHHNFALISHNCCLAESRAAHNCENNYNLHTMDPVHWMKYHRVLVGKLFTLRMIIMMPCPWWRWWWLIEERTIVMKMTALVSHIYQFLGNSQVL